jgi:hypothetical protein
LETAQKNLRPSSGNLYLLSIDNVLFVILIFGNIDEEVLPLKRHQPVGKESGKTSHIQRLNNTLRQRISRLICKIFSLYKNACTILGQFLTLYITIISASENDIITVHDYQLVNALIGLLRLGFWNYAFEQEP